MLHLYYTTDITTSSLKSLGDRIRIGYGDRHYSQLLNCSCIQGFGKSLFILLIISVIDFQPIYVLI